MDDARHSANARDDVFADSYFSDERDERRCGYCYGSRSDTGSHGQCDRYAARIVGNQLKFNSFIGGNFTFTHRGTSLVAEVHGDATPGATHAQFQKM